MKKEVKKWLCLDTKTLQRTKVFDLMVKRLRSPNNGTEDDFYIIKASNWVNIIALTPEEDVVMVKQHRFGCDEVTLELPGGIIDEKEDPQQAALRELVEETGFAAESASPLGWIYPNPAILTNRAFAFLATNTVQTAAQQLDPLEDIAVELVPLKEIPALIAGQQITHSLMIAAFMQLFSRDPSSFQKARS